MERTLLERWRGHAAAARAQRGKFTARAYAESQDEQACLLAEAGDKLEALWLEGLLEGRSRYVRGPYKLRPYVLALGVLHRYISVSAIEKQFVQAVREGRPTQVEDAIHEVEYAILSAMKGGTQ